MTLTDEEWARETAKRTGEMLKNCQIFVALYDGDYNKSPKTV